MTNNTLVYIAITNSYTLAVHPLKNRVYCTLEAEITNFPNSSEIRDAWLEIGSYLSSEFTILLDTDIEKVQHPELIRFLLGFQQIASTGGVLKIAEIVSGSNFACMVHNQIAGMSDTENRHKVFPDREHAEQWLDSPVA